MKKVREVRGQLLDQMKTLRMSALTKLKQGMTTIDEVGRVTAND